MTEPVLADCTTQIAAVADQEAAVALAADRRRPGRAPVNPALLPLLRGDAGAGVAANDAIAPAANDLLAEIEWEGEDAMKPARGIALGLLMSLPLWITVIVAYHEIGVRLAAPH